MAYRITNKNGVAAATNTPSTIPDIFPYARLRLATDKDLLIAIGVDPGSDDFLISAGTDAVIAIDPGAIVHFATANDDETGTVRYNALSSDI